MFKTAFIQPENLEGLGVSGSDNCSVDAIPCCSMEKEEEEEEVYSTISDKVFNIPVARLALAGQICEEERSIET